LALGFISELTSASPIRAATFPHIYPCDELATGVVTIASPDKREHFIKAQYAWPPPAAKE